MAEQLLTAHDVDALADAIVRRMPPNPVQPTMVLSTHEAMQLVGIRSKDRFGAWVRKVGIRKLSHDRWTRRSIEEGLRREERRAK